MGDVTASDSDSEPVGPTRKLLEILDRHCVAFILIGGRAASVHGSPLGTFDTDICYQHTEGNLERLAAALRELEPTLRGAPPDLPFLIDAKSLALGSNFTFSTRFGDFDILGDVEPLGGYDELLVNAEAVDIGGITIRVISLDDLIRIKEHLGRPKDMAALEELRAIKRERGG